MVAGPLLFGCVDEVNGPGSEAVDGYPITRHELLTLARHWYKESLDTELFWFFYNCSGSREIRIEAYAWRRIARIEALLGEDAVREVIDKVRAEARKQLGAETWRIITQGTKEERDRVQDETQQSHEYLDAKRADAATHQAAAAFLVDHPTEVYLDSVGDMWYLAESSEDCGFDPLILTVRTRSGAGFSAKDYQMDCPPGWSTPYGLR